MFDVQLTGRQQVGNGLEFRFIRTSLLAALAWIIFEVKSACFSFSVLDFSTKWYNIEPNDGFAFRL